MSSNYDDDVKRQMEKERIREQMIAEEITRRRILEEEVRRELMMMMENQIFPSQFGLFDEARFRGSNGGQPLLQETNVLAKPETDVYGKKRKTPTPEADCEGNNISLNKKLKGWNCVLCNVASTSEIDFKTHMQGRKHKAKVTQENSLQNINIISCPRSDDKASDVAKLSEKSNFWCEMCKVGATCANDMAAHEAGKKHLAKLRKYIPPKDMLMSCSTKPLCINGGDALLKETVKEIAQERLESTFIPVEMSQMLNADIVVVTSKDNGGNVLCATTSLGTSHVAKSCSLSTETSNTAMGSACDPGVKILSMEKVVLAKEIEETEEEVAQSELESIVILSEMEKVKTMIYDTRRGDGSSVICPLSATSESGVDEHKEGGKNKAMEEEVVVEKTVNPSPEEPIITLGIKKAIKNEHGRYVDSTEKGDEPGQFKFWYQMSQVETCPAGVLCDDKLYEEPCALPDVAWFIEEVAGDAIDEDVCPKGAK